MKNRLPAKVKLYLEYYLIVLIHKFVSIISINFVSFLGGTIFKTIGPLTKTHKVVKKNLLQIFPDTNYNEIDRKAKLCWFNIGRTFFELLILPKLLKEDGKIIIEGKKYLNEIITSKKKVIFISIHQSNWEILLPSIDKIGIPVGGIYRHINNSLINKLILKIRQKSIFSNKSFYTPKGKKSAKDIIGGIKNETSMVLLIDQKDSAGKIVNFFDYPTKTQIGFIKIARKYDMPIIPIENIRNKDNTFTLKFHKPINKIKSNLSDIEIMNNIHSIIEKWIKKNPSDWFLQHNRFS